MKKEEKNKFVLDAFIFVNAILKLITTMMELLEKILN